MSGVKSLLNLLVVPRQDILTHIISFMRIPLRVFVCLLIFIHVWLTEREEDLKVYLFAYFLFWHPLYVVFAL